MYDAQIGSDLLSLNTLFSSIGIDPKHVIVVRHRPKEPTLRRILPWLAAERHDLFNLYQSVQSGTAGRSMAKTPFLAVFIGLAPAQATFAGIYRVSGSRPLTAATFGALQGQDDLLALGMMDVDWNADEQRVLELERLTSLEAWIGKLTIDWPAPERTWWRRAERNRIAVRFISEVSRFAAEMPAWTVLTLQWQELHLLPYSWKASLAEWRGVYYIFDVARSLGYVGSAYGGENILGRWMEYAATGHGGNVHLKSSHPSDLRFSILQRTSPDLAPAEIVAVEETWKLRLHTKTHGLNG